MLQQYCITCHSERMKAAGRDEARKLAIDELHITEHATTSGIAAVLDGGRPGPTVLLRGDMDALPLHEDTDLEFESATDGQMHACGHDTHTAMLVGAAKLLSARRADIPGRVLFMFQPGEEGYAGAKFMLDEGLLELPKASDGSESPVTGAYALHVSTMLPSGFIASKGGPIMASSDRILVHVIGRGGHASQPHAALDPIPVACEIVQALQMMVTRQIDVFDPAAPAGPRVAKGGRTQPDRVVAVERIRRELAWEPVFPDVRAGLTPLL